MKGLLSQGLISNGKLSGIQGGKLLVAGNSYVLENNELVGESLSSYRKSHETQILKSGVIRVKFCIYTTNTSFAAYGKVYKNDIPIGIERINSTNSYIYFTEDFIVNKNDKISIYIKCGNGGGAGIYLYYFGIGVDAIDSYGTILS